MKYEYSYKHISEFIQLIGCILAFTIIYGYINDDDYHKEFDNPRIIKYNCDILIGGWHPDVPIKVVEECRKLKGNNVKSY